MIAVDTSTFVAYLAGEAGRDVEALDSALARNQAHLPPVVVTETLSAPKAPEHLARLILALPILDIADGYWERAGRLRRRLLARGLRAPAHHRDVADIEQQRQRDRQDDGEQDAQHGQPAASGFRTSTRLTSIPAVAPQM